MTPTFRVPSKPAHPFGPTISSRCARRTASPPVPPVTRRGRREQRACMQQASARCCGALSECRSRTTQETDARAPPVISDHGSAAAHLFGYRRSFGCKASPPPRRCWYIILASASRSAGTDISNMCRTPGRIRSKLGDQDRLDYRHKPILLFKKFLPSMRCRRSSSMPTGTGLGGAEPPLYRKEAKKITTAHSRCQEKINVRKTVPIGES